MSARFRIAIVAVLAGLTLASCGSPAPTTTAAVAPAPPEGHPPPAALAALTGPWRQEPLALDPILVAEADRVCRTDPAFPAGVALVLIDARGEGKLMSYYAGPGGTADCTYLEISAAGAIGGSLSGSGSGPVQVAAPGRLDQVSGMGSGGDGDSWQAVSGRAGAGITRVAIDVEGIGRVTASLRDGWFSAWWPIDEPVKPAAAPGPHLPMKDYVATGYDILGQPVDTTRSSP